MWGGATYSGEQELQTCLIRLVYGLTLCSEILVAMPRKKNSSLSFGWFTMRINIMRIEE